jgi:Transposase zinc-binding domain
VLDEIVEGQCDAVRSNAFETCVCAGVEIDFGYRNRHCPKCQSLGRDRWLLKQAASLLPVLYAHVVFTVSEQLTPLGSTQPVTLLFAAVSCSLREPAEDRRRSN